MKPEDQIPDLEAIRRLRSTREQDKRITAFMNVSDAIVTAAEEGCYSTEVIVPSEYLEEVRETLIAKGYYVGHVYYGQFVIGWEKL